MAERKMLSTFQVAQAQGWIQGFQQLSEALDVLENYSEAEIILSVRGGEDTPEFRFRTLGPNKDFRGPIVQNMDGVAIKAVSEIIRSRRDTIATLLRIDYGVDVALGRASTTDSEAF